MFPVKHEADTVPGVTEWTESDAVERAHALFTENREAVKRYVDILTSSGIERGLLGPREAERVWSRHILNSVAMQSLVPQGASLVDVGSGAGLPGIPLAILRPDLDVTLVESLLRRSTFLYECVEALGLRNVRVVRARIEDTDLQAEVVTCRAVAPLEKLVTWTQPVFGADGQLLALKGESAEAELGAASGFLARRGLRGEVFTVRADAHAEPTQVIKVTAA